MESIEELQKIVAKSKKSHFAPRHDIFVRKVSIYVTWFLLQTPLSANAVTILQTLVGVAGAFFLCSQSLAWGFFGIILMQFGYILDCCDGEIARYRKQSSVNGVFLDLLGHEIVIPAMYMGLAIGEFQRNPDVALLILGFSAGLFSLRFDISAMFQTVNTMFMKSDNPSYNFEALEKQETSRTTELSTSRPSIIRVLFRYPESMNVITAIMILDGIGGWSFVTTFLWVYGVLLPAARVWSIYQMIKNGEVEKKYREIVNAILRSENRSE